MKKPDTGMTAHRLAKEATPEALGQIMAIRLFNMNPYQMPIANCYWKEEPYLWLVANKIIKKERAYSSTIGRYRPRLTALGELVILSAAREALTKTGRLPVEDAEFQEVEP